MRNNRLCAVAAGAVIAAAGGARADGAAARKWIDDERLPSILSKPEQWAEMNWFTDAAARFSGLELNLLSEGIPTHSHESEVLTRAFENIAGIKVDHQIFGEGEVVQAAQTEI